MIVRRYSDESGNLDFDNYIGCLVRLDAMCRKWFEAQPRYSFKSQCIFLIQKGVQDITLVMNIIL